LRPTLQLWHAIGVSSAILPRVARPTSCERKLDRLGWSAGLSLIAHGVRVGIRTNDRAALSEIKRGLPPGWRPSSTPVVTHLYSYLAGGQATRHVRRFNLVYSRAALVSRTLEPAKAIEELCAHLRAFIGLAAPRRVFLEGAVAVVSGRAILLPGLEGDVREIAAALAARGADIYSNEYAVLDASGRLHPYTQPHSRRPVRPVLVARLRRGGARPASPLRTISGARGVLDVLSRVVPVRRKPAAAIEAVTGLCRGACFVRGAWTDANAAAESLLHRLARTPPPTHPR
jgi:hypothetical protein